MDELEQITRRYLLGELSEEDQAALERSYFTDSNVFNQVLQIESELVDAYARGQLSTEMRERFENSYLKHPSRRLRVKFAETLTSRIDKRDESMTRAAVSAPSGLSLSWWQRLVAIVGGQNPRWRFSMALVIVLIMLAGIWIFIASRRQQQLQRGAAETQAQREKQEQQTREQTAQQQPPETPEQTPQRSPNPTRNSAPSIVSLALSVGGVRGADSGRTQTLLIPHDTTQAQILLKIRDDSYPRYRVSLQKIGGAEIFNQTNIRPLSKKGGATFAFTVPARQFTSGDYALTLAGITPEGEVDYINKSLFRVEKR